jgi:haloacid dehalogenase-like hydrolase
MALPSPDDIKLIITDVDGTLLTSDHVIHPRTLSAFTKLRAAHPNLPIVIASGKQYNSCLWIRHALCLPPHFPATHCNGALIYGGLSGAALSEFSASLPPAVVAHIVDGTSNFGTFVFTEDAAVLVSPGLGVHKKDWCEIAARCVSRRSRCTRLALTHVRPGMTREFGIVHKSPIVPIFCRK